MKTITIYLLLILSFLFSQDDYYEFSITPEETEFGNSVGNFVSILNGELINYRRHPENGIFSDIYQLNNNEWILEYSIEYSCEYPFFQQLDEDMFIRSHWNNYNNRIRFFEKNESGIWYPTNNIFNPDQSTHDYFGFSFFRNADLLTTVSKDDNTYLNKIYIYRFDGIDWELEFQFQSSQKNIGRNGLFIDEEKLIIGFDKYSLSNEDSDEGAVQFFHYNDGNWEPGEYMLANNPTLGAKFGSSIIMNSDELLITAPFENEEKGTIYSYHIIDGEWTEVQSIQSLDIAPGDNFGDDIAVSGNFLIAGGAKNDDAGSISGSAYVFKKNENGLWVEIRKILASDIAAVDLFGASMDIDDTHIVVGAPLKNGLLGSVYVYKLEDTMLHSNFATYPVTGNAPLQLTFNDISQGDPTSWQWDFDSDGIIDNEDQYPEHIYEFSGDYTVTLTVTNNQETSTFTKENYVSVTGGLVYGDVNADDIVNITDILIMINIIMGDIVPSTTQIVAADMNNSGTIDIIDIVMMVNEILIN